MDKKIPQVIVELPAFIQAVNELWDEETQRKFKNYIGNNPLAGAIIPGTNGIRKIRWQYGGKGKRGGVRVIYYFFNENHPLFLLFAYPKNVQENLSEKEKKLFNSLIRRIKDSLRKGETQ